MRLKVSFLFATTNSSLFTRPLLSLNSLHLKKRKPSFYLLSMMSRSSFKQTTFSFGSFCGLPNKNKSIPLRNFDDFVATICDYLCVFKQPGKPTEINNIPDTKRNDAWMDSCHYMKSAHITHKCVVVFFQKKKLTPNLKNSEICLINKVILTYKIISVAGQTVSS